MQQYHLTTRMNVMSFRVAFLINACSYTLCQLNQINSEAVPSGRLMAVVSACFSCL